MKLEMNDTGEPSPPRLIKPLTVQQLRWTCDLDSLPFRSTADLDPHAGVVGQPTAREALEFGLQCMAPGQNVYVRGQSGTGRRKLVLEMLGQLQPKSQDKRDICYVQNFGHPDRPRLVTLPPGTGNAFRNDMHEFAAFLEEEFEKALDGEPYRSQREALQQAARDQIAQLSAPLEQELANDGMALVGVGEGPTAQQVILPVVDGQPVPLEQLRQLAADGKVESDVPEKFVAKLPDYQKRVLEVRRSVNEEIRAASLKIHELNDGAIRELTELFTSSIQQKYPSDAVREFLGEVIEHLIEMIAGGSAEEAEAVDLKEIYGVNVVHSHDDPLARPVIEECTPSLMNLLGTVEPKWGPGGTAVSDYRGIRAGALLRANNGYLILDISDLLTEPGAWRALTRTLRTGQLDIVPPEAGFLSRQVMTLPEPISIAVRVILIGDMATFYQLDQADPDFHELFKVLADFDSELVRDEKGVMQYGQAIAQLAQQENLPPFDQSAIAALAEHGARVVARRNRLTARFGRIADIAREAAFLSADKVVTGDQIREAIRRTKSRASLPSIKFQEMVENQTILVQTSGDVVGQINGLAVMRSGPLTYGFPARITASIGPGSAGLINVEGQAQMSGAIHTKGFNILGGLLRHLLQTRHPLSFSASLAFEQSYGGIDGDSASGAEIVCLLSALTGVPIRQEMAMTGAIDQRGNLEAIGGVNEKIEGFFDACQHFGLNGQQGVVIPGANAGDLMLRQDVVDACGDNRFSVYAVDSIYDAIELMTGMSAGRINSRGDYPDGTLLSFAQAKAGEFWQMTYHPTGQPTGQRATKEVPQPFDFRLPGRDDVI